MVGSSKNQAVLKNIYAAFISEENDESIPRGRCGHHRRVRPTGRPHPGIQYTLDKVEVERLCEDFARQNPGPRVVVLRPVTIVGPNMANFISRYLARSLMLLPRGLDPPFQFVHELDCARAACAMLFNDLSGAYNLGADGTVTLAEVGRRLGRRLVRVPRAIMKAMAELGWRLRLRGLSESNGAVVDFLCYVPVLDNAKIKREAGFSFRYTSSEAINDYLASRNSAVGTGRAGAT